MGQWTMRACAPYGDVSVVPSTRFGGGETTVDSTAVVAVDKVIAQKGSLPVASRYTCKRSLESEYSIDKKVLGSGMSGPVQLAISKADGRKYAVKSLRKKGLSARKRQELTSEVEIYLALDHPHVARLEMVFESDDEIDILMEYMAGGELYDRLAQHKTYTEEMAANTTYQMLLSVAYLHSHQIAHRDLKLENFLYQAPESNLLKLIDFGFAKFWDRSTKMTQACGSVHYVAPEVLKKSYTEKADLWSLGVIVYMLLTGSPPFRGSEGEVLHKIKNGTPHWSVRFQQLSRRARDFVHSLMVMDPSNRPSAVRALKHPWIEGRSDHANEIIDLSIIESLRNFAHSSNFKRACLSMMAWSLSTEDFKELREHFLALDTQKTGTITHQHMKQVLEDTFHIDCDHAEALFKSLDTNNDNEIDYTEFLAAAMQARVKVHEEMLRKTFRRFDHDEHGLITEADLRQVLGDHFEGIDVAELIREADTSGDGKIDYNEFIEYFHKVDEHHVGSTPSVSSVGSQKRGHIEKLGRVIDGLMSDGSSSTSPPTRKPNPLSRKGPGTKGGQQQRC